VSAEGSAFTDQRSGESRHFFSLFPYYTLSIVTALRCGELLGKYLIIMDVNSTKKRNISYI